MFSASHGPRASCSCSGRAPTLRTARSGAIRGDMESRRRLDDLVGGLPGSGLQEDVHQTADGGVGGMWARMKQPGSHSMG